MLNTTLKRSLGRHVILPVGVISCLGSPVCWGNGTRLPDQDGFAAGRGEAFVATADNPSAVYYNPAGITQLQGHNVSLGFYGIYSDYTYHSPSGGTYRNEDDLHAVPRLFYAYAPEQFPLSFGLGLYSPFGLSTKFPQDTGFRTLALEGSLTYMTVNPVVAWKILPNLSIGAGPTLNYGETDLSQGLFPSPGQDLFRFKGDDTAVGFNAGARWQPLPQLAFGASYRSATTMDYHGHTEMVPRYSWMEADASFAYPQDVLMGVSYRPTPKWNLEFDANYTDWSRLQTVTINQALTLPPIVFDWESSWYYELGVTRYFDNGWHVSAGYIFNQNSVPTATFNPLIMDLDRHFMCLGLGYKGSHFSFDVGYQLGLAPTRTVSGSPVSLAGQSADGRYEFTSQVLSVTVGWHF
jgi:long-chain fatty acid transport protein